MFHRQFLQPHCQLVHFLPAHIIQSPPAHLHQFTGLGDRYLPRHRKLHECATAGDIDYFFSRNSFITSINETEFATHFPKHAVSEWLGHDIRVSAEFYLAVPEELYAKVANGPSAITSVPVRPQIGPRIV